MGDHLIGLKVLSFSMSYAQTDTSNGIIFVKQEILDSYFQYGNNTLIFDASEAAPRINPLKRTITFRSYEAIPKYNNFVKP